MTFFPNRFYLYVVDLEPRVGTKSGKQRPCLAIQPSEFSIAGLGSTVVLPITTQCKGANAYPLRVAIPKGLTALASDSEIMIDQILAWDNILFRKELGPLPEAICNRVKKALLEFLDL